MKALYSVFLLTLLLGCSRKYELNNLSPAPYAVSGLRHVRLAVFVPDEAVRDRYESRESGSKDRYIGVKTNLKNFIIGKLRPNFRKIKFFNHKRVKTEQDIGLSPSLVIKVTDDAVLEKSMELTFSLTATTDTGVHIATSSLSAKMNFSTSSQELLEKNLKNLYDQVIAKVTTDVSAYYQKEKL